MERKFKKTTKQRYNILLKALKEIRDTQGMVCDNFELCHHRACRSSYSSWYIADTALQKAEEKDE